MENQFLSQCPASGERSKQGTMRSSNIELFRIVTMLFIVAHHYVVNSGLTAADGPIYADPLHWRSLFLLIFGAWGKIGINCFVMITGYFMCESRITSRKFFKLLWEVMFYFIGVQMIFWITGYDDITLKSVIYTFVPVRSVSDSFEECFLLFYLCIPFINILIQHLTEKQHWYLLVLSGFIYVFFGTFRRVTMNYVSWFIVVYFIASFIRRYPKPLFENKKLLGWLSLLSVFTSVLSVIACAAMGKMIGRNMAYYFVTDSNTFLAVVTGTFLFLYFKSLKIRNSKIINVIASSTFGVLLIHSCSDSMRQWLWRDTFKNVEMYESPVMPLHAIGSVILIFTVCVVIDQLRIRFIEKPVFALWDKNYNKVLEKFRSMEAKTLSGLGISQK